MGGKEQGVKTRIIAAALEVLKETNDIEGITVRQIAERAKVGIGSINYHFKSKDQLLSIAIGQILADTITEYSSWKNNMNTVPKDNLKDMLKTLCNSLVEYKNMIQFILSQDIMSGTMQTPLYLVPILKTIFGDKKTEIELRIIALQILQPLQIAGIEPEAFHLYSGFDLFEESQRNCFIDMLVDNLIRENYESKN